MTIFSELGYVIGDLVMTKDDGVGDKGAVYELIRDDRSNRPLFKLVSGRCNHNNANGEPGVYISEEEFIPLTKGGEPVIYIDAKGFQCYRGCGYWYCFDPESGAWRSTLVDYSPLVLSGDLVQYNPDFHDTLLHPELSEGLGDPDALSVKTLHSLVTLTGMMITLTPEGTYLLDSPDSEDTTEHQTAQEVVEILQAYKAYLDLLNS